MYFVYILYSVSFDRYYIGQTNDIEQRLEKHNSKQVRSTKGYIPWKVIWFGEKPDRKAAMELERKLKNLKSKERLRAFVKKYS